MKCIGNLMFIGLVLMSGSIDASYNRPEFPFAPPAGQEGTTAIAHDDPSFIGWADSVFSLTYGSDVSDEFRQPGNALGPAGQNSPEVLVLGRGGSVTLEFNPGIGNGEGSDFAVFENSFSDTFLELAFIEVSSDGENFVRFPSYSLTASPVGGFGTVQTTFVQGFAGKYRSGFGTPFDLAILADAHATALSGEAGFSEEYSLMLLEKFPLLELDSVKYVRIVDVVGDGSALDCEGFVIYDPYPTLISAGFDLDAIGVLNPARAELLTFVDWAGSIGLDPVEEADPDSDKWNNYMEYLLGTDPLSGQSRPVLEKTLSNDGSFTLGFWKWQSAESQPLIQSSTDGLSWTSVDLTGAESGNFQIREGEVYEWVELRFEGPHSSLFVRLVAQP